MIFFVKLGMLAKFVCLEAEQNRLSTDINVQHVVMFFVFLFV